MKRFQFTIRAKISVLVTAGVLFLEHPAQRVVELVDAGAEVIHLVFDSHGLESPPDDACALR